MSLYWEWAPISPSDMEDASMEDLMAARAEVAAMTPHDRSDAHGIERWMECFTEELQGRFCWPIGVAPM